MGFFEDVLKRLFSRTPRPGDARKDREREQHQAQLRFVVEHVFPINDETVVLQGKVTQGRVYVDQEVELLGGGQRLTLNCHAIEEGRRQVPYAWQTAKTGFGLFFKHPDPSIFKAGQVVAAPGRITPVERFDAQATLFETQKGGRDKPIPSSLECHLHVEGAVVKGAIMLPEGMEQAEPGSSVAIKISASEALPVETGVEFKLVEWGRHFGDARVALVDRNG